MTDRTDDGACCDFVGLGAVGEKRERFIICTSP